MATLEERFWSKVEKTRSCWLWTGRTPGFGHGVLSRGKSNGSYIYAHRLSYMLHKGEIPQDQIVRHRCDVPACVNPEHLELGYQADNVRDMVERGRNRNQNMAKDVCKNGHSLDDAIVYTRTDKREFGNSTRRRCRECSRLGCIAYRERKRAEGA